MAAAAIGETEFEFRLKSIVKNARCVVAFLWSNIDTDDDDFHASTNSLFPPPLLFAW